MKVIIAILFFSLSSFLIYSQKYYSTGGELKIILEAKIDTIKGSTENFNAILDLSSGEVSFNLNIEDIQFRSPLVLTNLGRDMMDLGRNGGITFNGNYKKRKEKKNSKNNELYISVQGNFNFNGVSKKISTEVLVVSEGRQRNVQLQTQIKLDEHRVFIPTILKDAISNTVKIELSAFMDPYADKLTSK